MRRNRTPPERDGVVVKPAELSGFPDLGVDSVVETDQSKEREKSGDDNFSPVSEL